MEPNFVFVLPEDHTSPSGGNLYNRFLLQALGDEGLSLEVADFRQALNYARSDVQRTYWVDSLYLSSLEELLGKRSPGGDVFFIAHHLPSLEPTRDDHRSTVSAAEEQAILGQVTGFLVTSPFTKEVLVRRNLIDKPILVVPPALCISPSGRGTEATGFRGLMVSNLIHRKGILEFLEELGDRVLPDDGFEIRIVGRFDIEPPYAEACVRVVENHPLLRRSVAFLGALPLEKLRDKYEESTAFISASRMETYGMSVQEARAFGLPVLACEAGYVKTHISSGTNGSVYASISELAGACVELIRRPGMLRRLRQSAYGFRALETYTWKDAARLFLKQYWDWKGHTTAAHFIDDAGP